MDKSIGRDKRRQDKHHKKPPPVKPGTESRKLGKENKVDVTSSPAAPLIVYDDHYSRRPIEPNWNSSRNLPSGDGTDDSDDDEQLRAADFEKLLQMPPSASGHFFLSSEKHWTSEAAEASITSGKSSHLYGEYFKIDTKQLNASLVTIPFHERNGYSGEFFSKQEIESMRLKADLEKNKSKNHRDLYSRPDSSKIMPDHRPQVTPPIKCLIGADALPPQTSPDVAMVEPIRHPVPCLIGPLALPPELRHDPNVTGSYRSDSAAVVGAITVQLEEVDIAASRPSAEDSVPIGADGCGFAAEVSSSKGEKDQSNIGRKEVAGNSGNETKEDIQQWLDDILDM